MIAATRVVIADWLLDAGLGASANVLLRGLRGPKFSDRRRLAHALSAPAGVYALVTHLGEGLVLPACVTPAHPAYEDAASQLAMTRARELVARLLQVATVPPLDLRLAAGLELSGSSIGLAAVLAFLAHCRDGSKPARPVFASGEVSEGGEVRPVDGLAEKLEAAAREGGDPLVLVPAHQELGDIGGLDVRRVERVEEAASLALGAPPYVPRRELVDLAGYLERAREALDADNFVGLLERLRTELPFEGDRVRVIGHLVAELRHLGRSGDAHAAALEALHQLDGSRGRAVSASVQEAQWTQRWLSEMDLFGLEQATEALSARLESAFVDPLNELRCRGALAQALAMAGDRSRAIEVRRKNLPLHAYSAELADLAPGTHCSLALDAAAVGRAELFEQHLGAMDAATRGADPTQQRYNAAARVRGWVYLGRFEEAIAWSKRSGPESVQLALESTGWVRRHPEVSIARALVRALRRTGAPGRAVELAHRVRPSGRGLVAWVSLLAQVEGALAILEMGDRVRAEAQLSSTRLALAEAHAAASAHHGAVTPSGADWSVEAIEQALDRVWY